MNPIDANRDTQKKIQTPTTRGNDHVNSNQGGSNTNKVNGDNRRHMRGRNHKNRGKNKQLIQHQSSNFTGADEILKVFLSPTERRKKFQFIYFK